MRAIRCLALTFLWLLGLAAPALAGTARGVVFDDRNANGSRDAGEPGLPGVRVSNGLDVIATDTAGRYEIAIDDDTIVFVLKPRDWQTALDKLNLSRSYYIHKPAGSPDDEFQYRGVKPTGPLPDSIDFPLTHSPEPDRFSAIIMGDPQPGTRQQVRFYANDVVAELVDSTAMFGISMGDIVGDKLSLFGQVNAVQATVGVPWYNVLGNHDINYYSPDDKHSDETFERVYGPANYAFQYGAVHFVVLDNVFWKGYQGKDPAGEPKFGGYTGALNEDQLRFVANYLHDVSREELIVVCTHIPLPELSHWGEQHSTPQLGRLLELLSVFPHNLSLSAHTHVNRHHFVGPGGSEASASGAPHHHHNVATASGSWYRGPLDEQGFPVTTMADGAPNGYIMATFDGPVYRLRYKAARMPAEYQMAIHTPEVVPGSASGEAEVVVNVFNGNERSKVSMRVRGHADWITMRQDARVDPLYKKLRNADVAREPTDHTPLPKPSISTHIWVALLPADLPPGVHVLEVESTDMFGQTDRGIRLIEVD